MSSKEDLHVMSSKEAIRSKNNMNAHREDFCVVKYKFFVGTTLYHINVILLAPLDN